MDKNTASKTKIVSIVISLGIIATLIIGVISVVRSVNSNRNNENNIVNLNETQENVAIKTEDVTDDVLGNIDDELQEANAGASMAVDTDNISNKADNTYNTHKAGTDDADKETEPTVPPTLSSEEVMAEAMKNFAFDESNKLAWPVLGQIVLDYNMDETIFFKSLGMYKCNPAIIIQSEVGTNVAAAASGIVTDVANLSETGTTVTGIRQSELIQVPIIVPPMNIQKEFARFCNPIMITIEKNADEIRQLIKLQEMLLSRLSR